MITLYTATYQIVTQDDASHYTSGYGKATHHDMKIAAIRAYQLANEDFDKQVRNDDTGLAGSGCCILHDGNVDRYNDGEKDLATYWSYDFYGHNNNHFVEMHRSPSLVENIKNREKVTK